MREWEGVILLAKYYFYTSKIKESEPKLQEYLKKLKYELEIEKEVAII